MKKTCLLSGLREGESGWVSGLELAGPLRRRLLDIELTQVTGVECMLRSPFGVPAAYEIRGAVFALRKEDACRVRLERNTGGVLWG